MTNTEQSQKAMFVALEQELETDNAAYNGNEDYEAEVVLFKAAHADNIAKAAAAHADNSGFSAEKLKEKGVLSDMASNLSGKAYVKFINKGREDLAEQLHIEPTDYKQAADSQCATLAQAGHDLMQLNLGLLSPTHTVTDAMLIDFQNEINKFMSIQGSSETVHEVSPMLTQEFKDSFKPVMMRVDHLKYLTRDYKISNTGFFDRLMASTVIPTINVHHTYVDVHAVWKNSGKPVEGMIFLLSNCKKTGSTNWEGNAKLEEVKRGKAVLRGELASKVKYEAHIVILNGKTNHYEVVIEEDVV
jgi:hypothetical protein